MTVLGQGALRVAAGSTDDPSPAREPATASEQPASAEPHSFDEWALARWPALVRFAWLTTGNSHDAQDAAQDALVGVYPRWSDWRRPAPSRPTRDAVSSTAPSVAGARAAAARTLDRHQSHPRDAATSSQILPPP